MDLYEVILFGSYVALFGVCGDISSEFSGGRTYVLNPARLSWDAALDACIAMNGSLATIRSMSTVPILDIHGDWTFWIGLRRNNATSNWEWVEKSNVTFFNWKWNPTGSRDSGRDCAVSSTLLPYWWAQHNCSNELPSLCELEQGNCSYTVFTHSGIIGHNRNILLGVSLQVCEAMCSNETAYVCRSFLYDPSQRVCTLTDSDRHKHPNDFRLNTDRERNYYQRTCDTGYIAGNSTESPLLVIEPTPVLQTSTSVLSTKSQICFDLRTFTVNENDTVPVMEEVKELQSIGTMLKKRASRLKKISVPDKRPSSTYIGTSAIAISLAFVALVVLLDLVSIPRYCRSNACCGHVWRRRKRHKKESEQVKDDKVMKHHFSAMKKHMRFLALQQQAMSPVDDDLHFDAAIFNSDAEEVLSEHSFTNYLFDDDKDGIHPVSPPTQNTKHYDWSDVVGDATPERKRDPKTTLKWPDDVIYDDVPVHRCKYVNDKSKYIYRSHVSTHL